MGSDKDRNSLPGTQESYRKRGASRLPHPHRISTTWGFFGPTGVVLWLLSRTLTEKSQWQLESGILTINSLCKTPKRHQAWGIHTHRAKTRQARYEVEGHFLPMDNLEN